MPACVWLGLGASRWSVNVSGGCGLALTGIQPVVCSVVACAAPTARVPASTQGIAARSRAFRLIRLSFGLVRCCVAGRGGAGCTTWLQRAYHTARRLSGLSNQSLDDCFRQLQAVADV